MRVNYERLDIHKKKYLKVDYTRLSSIPLPSGTGIRADLRLLGVDPYAGDPTYRDILMENLENIWKEITSWRVPMRWPSFKWAYVLAPAAGALCLCFTVFFGPSPAPQPVAQTAVVSEMETDTVITYIGSRNTQAPEVKSLTRSAEPVGRGVAVSVVPADEMPELIMDAGVAEAADVGDTGNIEGIEDIENIGTKDTEVTDTEVTDAEVIDTETTDTETTDTETTDTEDLETEMTDTEDLETEVTDAEVTDTEVTDTEITDTEVAEPEIVMCSANTMLNVRTEPSADAEIAGALYADSGATVLERRDGWTKIESGNLVGWASDEWLLTGDEAAAKLEESGHAAVEVDVSWLNVRSEPTVESDALGHVAKGDTVDIAETDDEEWAEIQFGGRTAYINTNYVTVKIAYNTGDTVDEMKEKAEEKAKAAAEASPREADTEEAVLSVGGAYEGTASELEMLATIIYCEAGNQPYEGKVAVGNVVLNRINSASFPNDMDSVLRAPKQFSPVGSGKYDRMLGSGRVPESCYDAARDAMSGISFVGGCLYFKNPSIAGAHAGITIQDHVFW